MNLQADFEAQEEENPFGGCQVCGSQGKVLNVGKLHFGHCEEHQTAWMIGSGLFSGWRFESPEVWEANKALLAKCDFSQE